MANVVQPIIPITMRNRPFEGHTNRVNAVAVFPDGCRMATASHDKTVGLWDLKGGFVLKKIKGHSGGVLAVAISRDGQLIASSDENRELIAWHGATGKSLTKAIIGHSSQINSLDFSPDGAVLVTGSADKTTKLWCTKTWKVQGNTISCGGRVHCVRFSPSGELVAIATDYCIEIWNPRTTECTAKFEAAINGAKNLSLVWAPDGTRLLSAGSYYDPNIREWDTSAWGQQVGPPWSGHNNNIYALAVNSAGTLIASTSSDTHVRLWQLSDRRTIAIFKISKSAHCVAFSMDGKHILSGGLDSKISQWAVPEEALMEDTPKEHPSENTPRARDVADIARSTLRPPQRLNNDAEQLERSANYIANPSGPSQLPNNDTERDNIVQDRKGKEPLVIERNPSSYLGSQLNHTPLHDAQRYDEAIEAFQTDNASDTQTQNLRNQYLSRSDAECAIRNVIYSQMENAPPRFLDTTIGRLCDRNEQIKTFKTSAEYKELLSLTMKHAELRLERIEEAVARYFRCVMLSHRWEENEPLLHDIQGKLVYELDPVGGIAKLQSFCKTVRDAGYRWAWIDTCCINQTNNVEVQGAVNSMFVWYRHSALTIVYLSDVRPSSKSGALAKSEWNKRGWTVQEFLAPKIVLFYQRDWTRYLGDCSSNHKQSVTIMRELAHATGIDPQALVTFRPGMRGAREKLQWVSMRVTTMQEDIAYSLFGIFGVHLPVIYGEKKQNALGRLLQEVVAQSGDISCLDWVGKPSEFNSCLPANITSYGAPPSTVPSSSEDEMQAGVSSLQDATAVESTSKLYTLLSHLSAPRFAARRLHLPCIIFTVTEIRPGGQQNTYEIKADDLDDLLVTTEDSLTPLSPAMPSRRTFLLVRPWDHNLLELSDFEDDIRIMQDTSLPGPSGDNRRIHSKSRSPLIHSFLKPFRAVFPSFGDTPEKEQVGLESYSSALRLIARLGQPFSAFLLAQQRGTEYKRIASDHNIIAQVNGIASIHDMMDIRTLEIL